MSEEERKALIEEMKKDANSADEKLQKALEALSPAALNAVKEVLQDEKGNADLRAHNGGVLMETSEGDKIFVKTTENGDDIYYKSDREGQAAISQHKDGRFSYTSADNEGVVQIDNNGMKSSDNNGSVEITAGKLIARDEEGKQSFRVDGNKWQATGENADGTYVLEGNGRKVSMTSVDESEGTTHKYKVKVRRKNGTMKSFNGEMQSEGGKASFEIGFDKDGKTVKSIKAESSTRSDKGEKEKTEISLKGENLTIKTVQVIDDGNGGGEKRKTELRLSMKGDSVEAHETLDELLSGVASINGEAMKEGSVNAGRVFESVQEKAGMIAGDVIDNVTDAGTMKSGEMSKEMPLVLRMKSIGGR